MKRFLPICVFLLLCTAAAWLPARASEIQGQYATIEYSDMETLEDFNYELYMGRLKGRLKQSDTIEEEVKNKIDLIVARVIQILDMRPSDLKFKIVVRGSKQEVSDDFKRIYGSDVNYIAFYSPSKNIVFYYAGKASLQVVAHEIGHVVAEHYFQVSPPARIHEVMAQYAEKHITD